MQKNSFLGVWSLKSWVLTDQQGQQHFPYGEDAKGFLIYTDVGFMSVHLMRSKRTLFQTESVFKPTLQEAYDSNQEYVSYCGSYDIKDNKVLHHVTMHTCPNWIGTTQERNFKMVGDELHLTHHLEQWDSALIWIKRNSIAS